MPSHRRGGVGESSTAVQLQVPGSHWTLGCSVSQGVSSCRSEPVVYYGANLAPLVDAESWFPGCEVVRSGGVQRTVVEMGVGSPDREGINADEVFPSLTDYAQTEPGNAWWPPLNVQIVNMQTTPAIHQGGQNVLSVERKPSDVGPLEPWFSDTALDVVGSTSTRGDDHPAPISALAAVSTALAEAAAAVDAIPMAPAIVTAAPAGPSRAGRVTKAASRKLAGKSVSGAKDTSLAVQKTKGGSSVGKRPLSQRQNHIWSERQRRKGMNYLFETLRALLPHPSPTNKTDKSTVVGEIIKYIQSLQVQLELLTKKQQQMLAARALINANVANVSSAVSPFQALPRAFVSNGLTLVDHSSDPSSLTAITALPPLGRDSCLQSYLGSNVGLHVCGSNVFITTSSPRGRRGLLYELLVTIHKRALDVINATISTSSSSIFHSLHCQASEDSELLNNDLHHALQSVINQFG